MQEYQYENEMELSLYPIAYTFDMALNNNDIIKRGVSSHNAKRMQLFMYNYFNKIPDKVTITDYGIGGYPTISKLQYTRDSIIFSQRYYVERYNIEESLNYQTFYGYSMYEKYRKSGRRLLREYILVTHDNLDILVFRELIGVI